MQEQHNNPSTSPRQTTFEQSVSWVFGVTFALVGLSVAVAISWTALLWFGAAALLLLPPVRLHAHRLTGMDLPPGARFGVVCVLVFCGSVFPAMQAAKMTKAAEEAARLRDAQDQLEARFRGERSVLIERLSSAEDTTSLWSALDAAERFSSVSDSDFKKAETDARARFDALTIAERTNDIISELRHVPASDFERNESLYAELAKMHPAEAKYAARLAEYRTKADEQRRKKAGSFSDEQICKAGVAALMGRSPTIMKTTKKEGGIAFFHYIRQDDGSKWSYRCKVEGARVVWASDTGRWRTHPDDEKVTYRVSGESLEIIQTLADGSKIGEKFTKSQLGK